MSLDSNECGNCPSYHLANLVLQIVNGKKKKGSGVQPAAATAHGKLSSNATDT